MLAVGAQTRALISRVRNTDEIDDLIADAIREEPIYDFDCPESVRQRSGVSPNTGPWIDAFAELPAIYIADVPPCREC